MLWHIDFWLSKVSDKKMPDSGSGLADVMERVVGVGKIAKYAKSSFRGAVWFKIVQMLKFYTFI